MWQDILRTVSAKLRAVPSCLSRRLGYLIVHDIEASDAKIKRPPSGAVADERATSNRSMESHA